MIHTATRAVRRTARVGGVLKLHGVGFKSFRRPPWVVLQLGYSHYVGFHGGSTLVRSRRAALAVGDPHVAARLESFRRPDPYKARGVYPVGVPPALKPGKRR